MSEHWTYGNTYADCKGFGCLGAMAFCIIFFALLIFAFSGCCPQAQTVTRTDTLAVPIYYTDTLYMYMEPDSNWFVHDTVIDIRVITKEKKLWYALHDTVKVHYTDTVQVVQQVTVEKTTWEKVILWVFPFLVGALLILLVVVWLRK